MTLSIFRTTLSLSLPAGCPSDIPASTILLTVVCTEESFLTFSISLTVSLCTALSIFCCPPLFTFGIFSSMTRLAAAFSSCSADFISVLYPVFSAFLPTDILFILFSGFLSFSPSSNISFRICCITCPSASTFATSSLPLSVDSMVSYTKLYTYSLSENLNSIFVGCTLTSIISGLIVKWRTVNG